MVKTKDKGLTRMNAIISELDAMCWAVKFDQDRAVELLKCIDPNEVYNYVPPHGGIPYRTTLLYRAVSNQNVDMMKLLLENGADPNFVDPEKEANTVMWDLMCPGLSESESKVRLEMAQIMLEYGASPVLVDDPEGNDLLSHVFFQIWADSYNDNWDYLCKFFILLVAYNGESKYCKPIIKKPFNKKKMEQYHLEAQENKESYHIVNNRGTVIAAIENLLFENGFFEDDEFENDGGF